MANDKPMAVDVFTYGDRAKVRVITIDDEAWFVAKDICDVLEVRNSRDALGRLDDDEKGVVLTDTPGGMQPVQVVNEPGLYALVLGSRKPEPKMFKRWVTHEVLPQIRKTGMYVEDSRVRTTFLEALEALVTTEKDRRQLEHQIHSLTPNAKAYETLMSGNNAQTMAQVCKALGTGRNRLFALLREKRVLMRNNLPYQQYLERGYFKVRQLAANQGNGRVINLTQTLVTAKGMDFIHSLLTSKAPLLLKEPTKSETAEQPTKVKDSPRSLFDARATEITDQAFQVEADRCFYCESTEVASTRFGKPICESCNGVEFPVVITTRPLPDEIQAVRLRLMVNRAKRVN